MSLWPQSEPVRESAPPVRGILLCEPYTGLSDNAEAPAWALVREFLLRPPQLPHRELPHSMEPLSSWKWHTLVLPPPARPAQAGGSLGVKSFLCDNREQEQDMDVGENCPGRTVPEPCVTCSCPGRSTEARKTGRSSGREPWGVCSIIIIIICTVLEAEQSC